MNKLRTSAAGESPSFPIPTTLWSMTDWGLDPGSLESATKTLAAVLDAALKLREASTRRRKAKRPVDQRVLDEEVDELRADLDKVVEQMSRAVESQTSVWRAIENLLGPADVPNDQRLIRQVTIHAVQLRALLMKVAAATTRLNEIVLAHENLIDGSRTGLSDAPASMSPRSESAPCSGALRRDE